MATRTSLYFQNLSKLRNLRLLSVQSNRITVLEGLDHCVSLEEVYFSHNDIAEVKGLDNLVSVIDHWGKGSQQADRQMS